MAGSQSVGEAATEMLYKIDPRKSGRTFSLRIDVRLMILHRLDYVTDEAAARRSWINIWSGAFEMPWDWRTQHR